MALSESEPLMSLSYAQGTAGSNPFSLGGYNSPGPMAMRDYREFINASVGNIFPQTGLGISAGVLVPQPKEAPKIMARLIRYTVVDPDPILADKKPEASILDSGMVMLNGVDDRGFVMDLAPKIAGKLGAHNAAREGVEYEDAEGRTKTLKPIRLGQLDVVVEKVREYAG